MKQIIIMLPFVLIFFTSCGKKDWAVKEKASIKHAYGKEWQYYRIYGSHYTRDLLSGHGILVENEHPWHREYLEAPDGTSIIMQDVFYAKIRGNRLLKLRPNQVNLWHLIEYNNKFIIYLAAAPSEFTDCKLFSRGDPKYSMTNDYAYSFYGDFDPQKKIFVIDRFAYMPFKTRDEVRAYSNWRIGKIGYEPEIEMYNKSEKYVCE